MLTFAQYWTCNRHSIDSYHTGRLWVIGKPRKFSATSYSASNYNISLSGTSLSLFL